MSLAQDILRAAERNIAAMPVELREQYRSVVPSAETLWPLAVLLASWYDRERTINGLDLTPYWGVIESIASTYPMLDVFVNRVRSASSDLDVYAAGAVFGLLVKAVGVSRLRLLLDQPIVARIKAAVPFPRDLNDPRRGLSDAPERMRRLGESPIRRFDAPRFGVRAAQDTGSPGASGMTPTDAEMISSSSGPTETALPELDPRTVTAGVLALAGWKPEEVETLLKGKGRA